MNHDYRIIAARQELDALIADPDSLTGDIVRAAETLAETEHSSAPQPHTVTSVDPDQVPAVRTARERAASAYAQTARLYERSSQVGTPDARCAAETAAQFTETLYQQWVEARQAALTELQNPASTPQPLDADTWAAIKADAERQHAADLEDAYPDITPWM